MILLPARVDFIGGWSDQLCWQEHAAVVNAAIGWEGGYEDSFPLRINDAGEVESVIEGVGTGLGVSSIIYAGLFLHQNPDGDYIRHALEKERREGTLGGWQDQIGAVAPGLKLIESPDQHQTFNITPVDHQILDHLVLFDTLLRRPAKHIGDQVRALIAESEAFRADLRQNVALAKASIHAPVEAFADACIDGWQRLNRHVAMDVPMPPTDLIWGHKLAGAGGGGYGVMFVKHPDSHAEVISILESFGYWATIPLILDGVQSRPDAPTGPTYI